MATQAVALTTTPVRLTLDVGDRYLMQNRSPSNDVHISAAGPTDPAPVRGGTAFEIEPMRYFEMPRRVAPGEGWWAWSKTNTAKLVIETAG